MKIPPHARVAVTEFASGDTIHVAPSIIVNNTYRTVARPPYINALESTTPEGRWAEATTLTTVTDITTTLTTTIPVTTTTYTITTAIPTTATTIMTSTVVETTMGVALLLGVIALVLGYTIARRKPYIVVAD